MKWYTSTLYNYLLFSSTVHRSDNEEHNVPRGQHIGDEQGARETSRAYEGASDVAAQDRISEVSELIPASRVFFSGLVNVVLLLLAA